MKKILTAIFALSLAGQAHALSVAPNEPDIAGETAKRVTDSKAISEADPAIDEAALDLFRYHEGAWDVRWEWFDPEGKPLGTLTGVEEYKTVGDGYAQIMVSTVHELKQVTHSLLIYNSRQKEILFFDPGEKGNYWVMHQDPVTWTMVSEPHIENDGKEMMIRFSVLEKSQDKMKLQMEASRDNGETWTVGFHQYNTRRTS